MSSLAEFLGPFATTRNQSIWEGPYMAAGMAAMLWSRITALNSVDNDGDPHVASGIFLRRYLVRGRWAHLPCERYGCVYPPNTAEVELAICGFGAAAIAELYDPWTKADIPLRAFR